jgi:hypothetical protein
MPQTWIWNWTWNGAPSLPSVCVSCNIAVSIRIASPGDDGGVTQSNIAQSVASSTTAALTSVTAAQPALPTGLAPAPFVPAAPLPTPPAPGFSLPPPPALPAIPPPPVIVAPPLGAVAAADGERELTGASSGRAPPPLSLLAGFGNEKQPARVVRRSVHVRAKAVVRARTAVLGAAIVHASVRAYSRVVVVQRSNSVAPRHGKAAAATPPSTAKAPPPSAPRTPTDPFGPAAGSTSGAAGHGSGGSVLTVSLITALALIALALLSGVIPAILPGRRRLNDDPRTRPG